MNEKLKQSVFLTLMLSLATLVIIGYIYSPAYAQVDEGTETPFTLEPLTSTGEGESRILTSNWRELPLDGQHIYRFDYDGNEQPIRIWLNVIPTDGAQFEIWTDDMFLALESEPDLQPLATGTPLADGSEYLLWQGSAPESDSYFVTVNSTGAASQYMLNISSPGLSAQQQGLGQPTAAPTPIPPTETPIPEAPLPETPANTPVPDPNEGLTPVDPNAAVATADPNIPPATPLPNVVTATANPNVAVVTTAALNVRTGPSTAYPIITAVPHGTTLAVLGRNESNTWIAVRLADGTEGWVTRSLTDYVALAAVVITPEPPPTPTPAPGVTPVLPATPSPSIVVVEADLPRELDGNWQVLLEGETHWYTFQYRGGGLPVHVWMDVEPSQGAIFNILNQQTAMSILAGVAPTVVNAIGRGTANPVEPGYFFWRASFPEADTFYVMVQHDGPGNVIYSIHAAGPGLGRPVPQ